jgi:lipoprotein-releasing system ATP-binding protein
MLNVQQLEKSYPTRAETLHVLRGIDLTLQPGEAVAIMGPSGCGKSTLLHILGALDRPSAGEVRLAGENPFVLDDTALAGFRNRQIGFVFQDHYLLPQCTVLENVLIPTLVNPQTDRHAIQAAAEALLKDVGLGQRLTHTPAELSGGERQRVAIARALIQKPSLILADEPTGNLDRQTASSITELLAELPKKTGAILIAVTHGSDFAARMPRTLRMEEGRLVQ